MSATRRPPSATHDSQVMQRTAANRAHILCMGACGQRAPANAALDTFCLQQRTDKLKHRALAQAVHRTGIPTCLHAWPP